jgi:hypothetical protein
MPTSDKKEEVCYARVIDVFNARGIHCCDINGKRIVIEGRDVYVTSDPKEIKILDRDLSLFRFKEAVIDPVGD